MVVSRRHLGAALLFLALVPAMPAPAATGPRTTWLAATGDHVVFDADDGTHQRELWSSDLTGSGTGILHDTDDTYTDLDGDAPGTSAGGPVWYLVDAEDDEVWRTDGTTTEQVLVLDYVNEMLAIPGGLLHLVDDVLSFVPDTGTTPVVLDTDVDGLWPAHVGAVYGHTSTTQVRATDGTPAGTVTLGSTTSEEVDATVVGARRTWVLAGDEVLRTDGTAGDLTTAATLPHDLDEGAALGDLLVGSADIGSGAEPVVVSDAGASALGDLAPGAFDSDPGGFVAVDDRVVFVAQPGDGADVELWRTDGTQGGTTRLAFVDDHGSVEGWRAAAGDGFAVLVGHDGGDRPVVVTDATVGGTFQPGATTSSDAPRPVNVDGRVAFVATTSANAGGELWVSDGTATGTHAVADPHPSPSVDDVLVADTLVYVVADAPGDGPSVWSVDRADPTGSTPALVDVGDAELVAAWGDDLVFARAGDYHHLDAATGTVTEIAASPLAARHAYPADTGMYVITSLQEVHHVDLAGAAPYAFTEVLSEDDDGVEALGAGLEDSAIGFGEDLVLHADADVTTGSDGRAYLYDLSADTLVALTGTGDISRLINARAGDGVVFFEGQNSPTTDDVWVTDGTPGGTHEVATSDGLEVQAFEVAPNGTLVIPADGLAPDDDNSFDVYAIIDPLGTPSLERWSDLVGDGLATDARIETVLPVSIGGDLHALAVVDDRDSGRTELVLVDPTGPDTVFDLTSHPEGARPDQLTRLPATGSGTPVVFSAHGDGVGREPWVLRPGTGTVELLADLVPGGIGSIPSELAAGSLWFAAGSAAGAHDLWYQATPSAPLVNVTAPTAVDDTATVDEDSSVVVDVLANDTARTGALEVVWTDGADHGTTTVTGTGEVHYVPDPEFFGTDAVTYLVADDLSVARATLTIEVTDVPEPDPTPEPTDDPDPTPTPTPAPVADEAERVAGDTRADTALAVAARSHPKGAPTVLLARQDAYPDALAGAPLARALDAPVLLTDRATLLPSVADAIEDLGATRVVLLGGPAALTPDVADAVAGLDGVTDVDRLGGATRFETAALVAAELPGEPTAAYVTEGANADPARGWPDALSVSPLAAAQGRPILLVTRDALPDETAQAIADLGITDVTVVGGEVAVAPTVVDQLEGAGARVGPRLSGDSRYATSAAVARAAVDAGAAPGRAWFATGLNFPDALVAGPAVAADGGVMLLLHGQDVAGAVEALAWLDEHTPMEAVHVLGGPGAVADEVVAAIDARLP